VGAAFDLLSGTVRQAPAALQRAGLEWAFRLWQEPRRLWRRYAQNNPLYLVLAVDQLIRYRLSARGRGVVMGRHR
jgi:N-acetylglucosaminyldiphosphoundecaprenol N-acetyl-beta-D-mannosaminyltransferase